jgi:hypothetical protein
LDHAWAMVPSKKARQINPVIQMMVWVKSELRLARSLPTVSCIPTAEVTLGLFPSGCEEDCALFDGLCM